jgi:solute carrier family 34 (sodium-dependent phosphate cotransporter)
MVNFGKNYKNEVITEWENKYFDYNSVKKITNRNELRNLDDVVYRFKQHDEYVLSEINKINKFYTEKIQDLVCLLESDPFLLLQECDKLRHFILLNTISIVKAIKRRNKRTPNTINVLDFIGKCEFYDCTKLNDIYSRISEILKKSKLEHANSILDNSSMLFSLKTLRNIREKTSFNEYNLLPKYTGNFQNDESLIDYLNNKLGLNNLLNVVEVNDNISLRDLTHTSISRRKKILYSLSVPALLYLFLFGLDLMSNSFKVLSGKGMNQLFSSISNPIAGVMVGIVATVLLQSSSTTTSIVVAMTGSNILDVKTAIPIIMGANIGTSVTNTLVSHAHIRNINEFKLAFAGATVHDMFNYLSVLILLPIEIISGSLGYALLYNISKEITGIFVGTQVSTFESPLKTILNPFTKLFISIDKNVIKGSANGCISCININASNTTDQLYCWNLKMSECMTKNAWENKYTNGKIIKSGMFENLSDLQGGIVGLVVSLVILCIVLYLIVKVLHTLVLSSNGRGKIMRIVQRSLSLSPYITMIVGMLLTIAVQSSSIITSTFTPLVGLSILTVEQMYPLTLGSNIGTTCTAFLASLVTDSTKAIQIAVCHFIFNIMGIIIWFPLPVTRKIPLGMAYRLGDLVTTYRWFGIFYITYLFIAIPLISLGISYIIALNTIGLVFGIILLIILCASTLLLFKKFEKIVQLIFHRRRIRSNIYEIEMSS